MTSSEDFNQMSSESRYMAQGITPAANYCKDFSDQNENYWRNILNISRRCSGAVVDLCYETCLNDDQVSFNMYDLHVRWPIRFAHPIYGIVFPILLVLLVISNIFVVVVLSKKHMVSPTNRVLCFMAIADLFVGLVPAPFTIYYFTLENFRWPENHQLWWCYMAHYLMDVLPPIAHNSAIWLTVLLAVQRYIYVRYPLSAVKWCTIANVQSASLAILVGSVLPNVLKFYEVTFDLYRGYNVTSDTKPPNPSKIFCGNTKTRITKAMGENFYPFHFYSRAILFIILPSIILVILNILLIISLREARARRARLVCENRSREANRQKESNSTSLMLILVVSIFLLVNLPQAFMFIIICVNQAAELNLRFFEDDGATLFVMVDNMLIMATYPLNFAIYCSTSTQFRDTFRGIFCSYVNALSARRASSMTTYTYHKNNDDVTKKLVVPDKAKDNDSVKNKFNFYPELKP